MSPLPGSPLPVVPYSGWRAFLFGRPSRSTAAAARTTLIYVGLAALWIAFSDVLLFAWSKDAEAAATAGMVKGWAFVVVTAALLFWLLRSRLERARSHEETLQLFVDHAPVALAMLDRELRYVTVSRRWRADHGVDALALRGRRLEETFLRMPAGWAEGNRRALKGEALREDAERIERADGTVQWLRWQVRPWMDPAGAIGGVVMFTEDITERKRLDEELAAAQAKLRLSLECGRVGTRSWDVQSGRIECDETFARLLGRSREELMKDGGALFTQCIHPEDRLRVQTAVAAALREGVEFVANYRIVQPDGQVLWITDRASVQRDATGQAVRMIGASADLTEVKRMESALHASEDRFREVVETIREVFWVTDVAKTNVLYVSPAYTDIWGRPCEDVYTSSRTWLEAIHPDDRTRVLQAARTRQTLGTYDETYRVVRPDSTVRWVRDRAFPVKNERGDVVRLVGTAEDVTERKRLEEQFLRAQRLEAIGTLASGVAHDLNNILAPMFMISPLLSPKLADDSDRELLTIVERSAQRGADVVRQLLTFSRGIAGERGPLQVRHLVKEMVAIMRETFPREVGINDGVPGDLPAIVGDATQLHQVLMNLCVNARDAMPDGGKLSITAKKVVLEEADVADHREVKAGLFVQLSVADTGQGIPPELRARIFEPFFTTKDVGKGTGLGLSTVLGIVKSHGGFVTVVSEVGCGSTFQVYLPAAETPATSRVSAAIAPHAVGGGQLVLVVDDEPSVRTAMQQVLERHGYRVLTAAHGREGLGLFMQHRAGIQIVVTDLMMPEMGGVALVRALRDLSPQLAIVAATGIDGARQRESLAALGVMEVLPKPYAPAELLGALKRELTRVAPPA